MRDTQADGDPVKALFQKGPKVINVGLADFADDLQRAGHACQAVDWRPPAGGDPHLADLLAKMGS